MNCFMFLKIPAPNLPAGRQGRDFACLEQGDKRCKILDEEDSRPGLRVIEGIEGYLNLFFAYARVA